MAARKRRDLTERSKTDKSLRTERENTDRAIRGDRDSSERSVEGVIEQARVDADAVVSSERVKADEEAILPPRPEEAAALRIERKTADRITQGQRDNLDGAFRSELEDRANALDALLVHERAATDAYLLTERARSDDDVANRDDFLGMVAHDVRNLLGLVVLSLELLKRGDQEPEPHVSAAAVRIRRYAARMNRLIGDLVDVTAIDAGKLAMSPVEGDVRALLAEATEAFSLAAQEKGLTLSAEIADEPLRAEFDHDRILQVFANLISNSIKFTPRGGAITIRTETVPGMLRFCVSDTGAGIPAPMLEAIFERFWQVGENDHRGMGLGLYISKCIVEGHNGRIWAESEPGRGSRLYFTLPVK